MKMGWIVTGFLAAGLFVLSFECHADQRTGYRGGKFRRGFAGPRSGPVLRERSGLRPPQVFTGNQNGTGFEYPYRNRSVAHGNRYFSRRNGLFPFTGFAISTLGLPWAYPYGYDDGELDQVPAYGVATVTSGGSATNDPAGVAQPVIVQHFYPQNPVGQAIRSGSDRTQESKESVPDPAGARQLQSVAPEPDQAARPQAGPAVAVPSPAARAQAGPFAAYVLVSWHQEDGKTAALIENTETNAVQEITTAANGDNLRIVTIHPSANPKLSEVVISNGVEEGVVKFSPDPAMVGIRRQ